MVGDLFGDQRAALLSGRTQPKKASFRLGRRELILTHETRSQCPAGPVKYLTSSYNFVNSPPTFPVEDFVEPLSRSALRSMWPGGSQHYPLTRVRDMQGSKRLK